MELLSLDEDFQPNEPVENYSSLIWTERYSKSGDFQLVSNDIAKTVKALPIDSYVGLRESTQIMKVEFHKIEKSKKKTPQITITGRTFEATTLELRGSIFGPLGTFTPRLPWSVAAAKESDAAYEVIRRVIGDTEQTRSGKVILPAMSPGAYPQDAIPEVKLIIPADYQVTDWNSSITYRMDAEIVVYGGNLYYSTELNPNVGHIPSSSPTYWLDTGSASPLTSVAGVEYEVRPDNLYTVVMEFLAANFHGIKSVKPAVGENQVGIEIYNGSDRRSTVRFEARFDQMDNATYLLGNTGAMNVAYVYSAAGGTKVGKTTWDIDHPEPSGLNRRVLVLDESAETTVNSEASRISTGLVALYQNNATALFGGEVAIQVAKDYNRTYYLGDILRLVGDYGLSQDVRVAEFIRTADSTGEKAYPTFEAIS